MSDDFESWLKASKYAKFPAVKEQWESGGGKNGKHSHRGPLENKLRAIMGLENDVERWVRGQEPAGVPADLAGRAVAITDNRLRPGAPGPRV